MTPEEGGVRDPSHPQGNTRVSLADTSLTRALIGSGGIQGGGAGAGVGEGGRAGTGLGGEQGVDTGEARGGRRVGVHSEDHGVEVMIELWMSSSEELVEGQFQNVFIDSFPPFLF